MLSPGYRTNNLLEDAQNNFEKPDNLQTFACV